MERAAKSARVYAREEVQMKMHLRHKDEMILDSLLGGKLPHNLRWNDVVELIANWVKFSRTETTRSHL